MKDLLVMLYRYDAWANAHILQLSKNLGPEELVTPPSTDQRTLLALLFHTLRVEWVWRNMSKHGSLPHGIPQPEEFQTVEAIELRSKVEAQLTLDFLTNQSDEELGREMEIRDWQGTVLIRTPWQMLLHNALHCMQHRSEAAEILTSYGHSPGDIDFIFFLSVA